jgi:lipopolysaccharide transport system permease protein
MPLSLVLSNLVKLSIQLALFLFVWAFFLFFQETPMQPNWVILLTPLLILIMGGLGLGFGMLISALTTKYRDLVFLLTFGIQLLMYATPVIYSLSNPSVVNSKFKWLIMINPMSSIIETFRYAFLGTGYFNPTLLGYSLGFTIVLLSLVLWYLIK